MSLAKDIKKVRRHKEADPCIQQGSAFLIAMLINEK